MAFIIYCVKQTQNKTYKSVNLQIAVMSVELNLIISDFFSLQC